MESRYSVSLIPMSLVSIKTPSSRRNYRSSARGHGDHTRHLAVSPTARPSSDAVDVQRRRERRFLPELELRVVAPDRGLRRRSVQHMDARHPGSVERGLRRHVGAQERNGRLVERPRREREPSSIHRRTSGRKRADRRRRGTGLVVVVCGGFDSRSPRPAPTSLTTLGCSNRPGRFPGCEKVG